MRDAISLLKQDHKDVKDLFERFEATENAQTKKDIAQKAIRELDVHAEIEEKIFYPAVRKLPDVEALLMAEANEEHHVAKMLIEELRKMRQSGTKFEAKFMVLAESVKHHIEEEEGEMLPKAQKLGASNLAQLGEKMMTMKEKLLVQAQKKGTRRSPSRGRTSQTSRRKSSSR